jgi:hypothetical protein
MRNYKKTSVCPASAQKIIDAANSIPAGYSLDHKYYPEGMEKQKKYFFEIIATLPNNFADKHLWLQKVLNGETLSPKDALQKKKGKLFDAVSKRPPKEFEKGWIEYLIDGEEFRGIYPLNILFYFLLQKAIPCRQLLTSLNTDIDGISYAAGGNLVLLDEIKDSLFETNRNTGTIKLDDNSPLSVIINERLDARRFRICPICSVFFWAKRLDAISCGSKKCVETSSGKKYHLKNKAEINQKKREKYYIDTGIDFCPNCIRPTPTCECKTPQAFVGKSKDLID